MKKGKRILLFIICLLGLAVIYFLIRKDLSSLPRAAFIIIFTSLIMLSFVILLLEHFFTTPTDVLAVTISIMLLLSPLQNELKNMGIWYFLFFIYNLAVFVCALIALLLLNPSKASETLQNRISKRLKKIAVHFGNGRWLFFGLFILMLLSYVDSQSKPFLVLFFYSAFILFVDPKKYIISSLIHPSHETDIGEIFSVQSKNTFLAKLYKERKPVRRYDLVEFCYSVDEHKRIMRGFIFDNYLLNKEQWIKILSNRDINNSLSHIPSLEKHQANVVYKLEPENPPEILKRFVGIVVDKSKIEKLRFEYAHKVPVAEGDLLEVKTDNSSILYQVVQGITETEQLESKNEAGYIVGEATQLGLWDSERRCFEKYGWVPDINTPVFLASEISQPVLSDDEFKIGSIPSTNYPILINVSDAVTHHLAILGVTGSGKSVLARHLIREIVRKGLKIICVDFTGEYRSKFSELHIDSIISAAQQDVLFEAIDKLSLELSKFRNQQDPNLVEEKQEILNSTFKDAIENFLKSDDKKIALFELPDVANTTGILEYTKWFFRALFLIARKSDNFGKRVCIVLEEAHTVIPEFTFIGVSEKEAQSLVNNIGQIALQGRKYKVGFIVIAQRTANVSKTVLTQCNSVIAFQQFDKTGSEFLANYMGQEMVNALPSIKFRQAIAVGKAFTTGIPIIFEVPEITE